MPRSGQATVNTTFRATDQMRGPMRNMQRNVSGFSRSAQRDLGGISRSFNRMRNLARLAGGVIAGSLVARGIGGLVRAAASMETVTTQFETLTGSAEKARDLVQQMQEFAASTPLQFDTLAQGTQRLLAFGIAQEDVLSTLQTLGDAATGDANKLDSLTRAYGKVAARGRASMEEINMVIDAGVPIMDALNQEFGTTTEELTKMISNGEVTSEVFQNAFRRMTREGGMFHRGMQRQSQTTAGLFSTLKDNVTLTAASIGTALLPTINDLTQKLIALTGRAREWIANNQDLIRQRVEEVIQRIVEVSRTLYQLWDSGVIPAILAAVIAFRTISTVMTVVTTAMGIWTAVAATATGATTALGAAIAIAGGPFTLIAAAIAGVIALVVLLIKHWDTLRDRFNNTALGEFLSGNNVTVEEGRQRNADRYGLTSSNMAGIQQVSRSESVSRSELDVNFRGAPRGTQFSHRGVASGVSLNFGAAGGQL